MQDISARKQAEQERSDSETRLREANERLQKFAGHLDRTLENERLRIARALHDDLGSTLAGIKWAVAMWIKRAEDGGSPLDPQLGQALQLLDSAVDTMRRIRSLHHLRSAAGLCGPALIYSAIEIA